MEFSYDFGSVQSSAPQKMHAPLWAAIEGRISSLAGDEVVFFDPLTARSHVMTRQVLQALELCRAFAPMSVHIDTVANTLPGLQGKQAAIKPVLESLQTRGLLQSDDAFLQRMRAAVPRARAPVSGLFVRACNRPAQLEALLASLLANASSMTAAERLVVVDDSTSQAAIEAHVRLLQEFAGRWPYPVHHVTPALWRAILQELNTELPEHASALAGVLSNGNGKLPGSGGSGRNLITLLAAGSRYLILDDDNLLPLHRMADSQRWFDPNPAKSSIQTFSDHDAALASGVADEGAISWHLDVCGRSLGEVLGASQAAPSLTFDSQQLSGFAPSHAPHLVGNARIATTVNGHRGGSCATSMNWLLTLDATSRAGLCESEASYLASRGDASLWVGFDRTWAARMATISPFAVDNSQLMPCTTPLGRAEDLVFNALVTAGHAGCLQLLTPHTAGHRPELGRDRSAQLNQPRMVSVGMCVGELIGSTAEQLHSASVAGRYASIASRLEDMVDGSDARVASYLREFLVYERAHLLSQLQEALPAANDAPAALRSDISRQIELNARAIVERGIPRFSNMSETATEHECAEAFRDEASTLSQGLRAWPAAWEVALSDQATWLERARVRP
ncbi:MAG: hypothetical protein ACT4NL_08265 [Pseudomarimonas sp.]